MENQKRGIKPLSSQEESDAKKRADEIRKAAQTNDWEVASQSRRQVMEAVELGLISKEVAEKVIGLPNLKGVVKKKP